MKNLIEKLLKGETLTADERAKLEGFDPEKAVNDAAAAARKKAEGERDAARTELETLKKSAEEGKKGSQTETQKLLARIEKLEKEKAHGHRGHPREERHQVRRRDRPGPPQGHFLQAVRRHRRPGRRGRRQ